MQQHQQEEVPRHHFALLGLVGGALPVGFCSVLCIGSVHSTAYAYETSAEDLYKTLFQGAVPHGVRLRSQSVAVAQSEGHLADGSVTDHTHAPCLRQAV